ncbi:hypothetical protein [Aquimarina rhabdastrellae]
MKNQTQLLKLSCIIFLVLNVFTACKKEQKVKETPEVEKAEEVATSYVKTKECTCESDWFPHTQTPAPEEGVGSPFDSPTTTNCIFHQWSWQKFLWLTKPQSNYLPLFLNELTQVNSNMIPVTPVAGVNVVLEDTAQAGSSGILKTNPAYNSAKNTAATVYYSIHISDTLKNAAAKFKTGLNNGTIPQSNLETFPVGSLELKVSWVTVDAIPADKQANYYKTKATIDGKAATVALLGMHVVGVVINHPEFIWATFEHNDLAPNYDWPTNQANSTTEQLLYTKGTTTGLDGITWTGSQAKLPAKAYDLFQYGVPVNPDGSYMTTSQSEPKNFDNIRDLNKCVQARLTDVFQNYFYNGSIWMDTDGKTPTQQAQLLVNTGGDLSKATPGSVARGSLNAANVTMETYTQTFESTMESINVDTLANCFSCHNAVSFSAERPTSPLYISHIFDGYLQTSQGKTEAEIDQLKDQLHEYLNVKK